MKTIYKYSAHSGAPVPMPIGAEIVSADVRDGKITIWALIDTEAETEQRRFIYVGTGFDVSELESTQYIGTVFDGPFVWHVFEFAISESAG